MAHKYLVDLTDEEQRYLHDVIRKGKTTARRVARAHVLLQAAAGVTDAEIAVTFHLGIASVHRIRQRFVDEGLTVALSERSRIGSPPVLTGKQSAFLVALACSTPPAGRHRWTLKLLEAVEKLLIDYSEEFSVAPSFGRLNRPKTGWRPDPLPYRSKG